VLAMQAQVEDQIAQIYKSMGTMNQQVVKAMMDTLRGDLMPALDKKDANSKARSEKMVKNAEATVIKTLRDARTVVRGIKLD
jgi:hypothetical protein